MTAFGKKPTLTIVAGREGPTEGPYSNAARIAAVAVKLKKRRGNAKPDLWAEAGVILSKLNVKGRLPEAVKCLQLFLAKNVSATALVVRQRGPSKSNAPSEEEFRAKIEQLDEYNQQYIAGYMQGLLDGRPS